MLVNIHARKIGDEPLVAVLLHIEDQNTLSLLVFPDIALGTPRKA